MINPVTEKCKLSMEFAGDIPNQHGLWRSEKAPERRYFPSWELKKGRSYPERKKGRKKNQKECPAKESQRDHGRVFKTYDP